MKNSNITVIALGGSLIVPHLSDEGGVDVAYLKKFRAFLLAEMKKGNRFVVVAGGGKTARLYQSAVRQFARASSEHLDWVGIHATKLNAYLLLTLFGNKAYPEIINSGASPLKIRAIQKSGKALVIAGGWRPGQSTDQGAVALARAFGARDVIIAGNTAFVFDKDPGKFADAKKIPKLSWSEYQKIIPRKWKPGFSSPVDPVAARLAKKTKLTAKIIKGTDMKNFQNAIVGKPFRGTTIRPI